MKYLTARMRVSIGLVFLLASLLIIVISIGIGPNEFRATQNARVRHAETVALACSIHLNSDQKQECDTLLQIFADREESVVSVAIRENDGELAIQHGPHEAVWTSHSSDRANTNIVIPIRVGTLMWGQMEVVYNPIHGAGFLDWFRRPWTRYVLLTSLLGFFVVYFYLDFVNGEMNPADTSTAGRMKRLRQRQTASANGQSTAPPASPAKLADSFGPQPFDSTTSSRTDDSTELVSDLPMDDDDFRIVVELFVYRLDKKFAELTMAIEANDFGRIAELAHWLKGSAGTAGFHPFTRPSTELEESAVSRDLAGVLISWERLATLKDRIQVEISAGTLAYI